MQSSRRQFLIRAGSLLAGLTGAARVAHSSLLRHRVIDIHAHCVIPEVASLLAQTSFRNVRFPSWQALDRSRLDTMSTRGIDVQVLSINRFWWYGADKSLADDIVRLHDQALAAWCQRYPDRFVALTSVALQYPELAADQLERAVTVLGARGAAIGGTVLGESLSSARFDPFWAKAEALDVPVFMHPTSAAHLMAENALSGSGDLGNIIGNPLETALFLSRLIYDGTLDRFPGLTVCAPHAGGYLPAYLSRSEVACDVRPNAKCQNTRKPSEYLRRQVLFDSMVFSEEGLRHLVAEVGADRIVYGSDMPFNWPDTIDLIVNADFLTEKQKQSILGGTLERLLAIA